MGITDAEKKAIDEAVEELHFVETDKHGDKFIRIHASFQDTNEGLLQTAYDARMTGLRRQYGENLGNTTGDLKACLRDEIDSWYSDSNWDKEDDIIRHAGFDPSDDMAAEQLEYLRDTYPFVPDYDHFLNQDMRVNLLLDAGDKEKHFFSGISEQFQAMLDELEPEALASALAADTGLSWLVRQQGHTMKEMKSTLDDYIVFFNKASVKAMNSAEAQETLFCKDHNRFLASVCRELFNTADSRNMLTVLTGISMNDFADFLQPGKEILLPKDSTIGFYNPWSGAGSMLEIELEKELVIPSEALFDVQIEGAKLESQRSLDKDYGLIGSAWKPPKGVRNAEPAPGKEKRSLTSLIASAENRAPGATDRSYGEPSKGR